MSYRDIVVSRSYKTNKNDIVRDFYVPTLKESVLYKRAVGFFSSTALIELSKGISGLVKNGGKIKFIVSPLLSEEDIDAITKGYNEREIIESALLREFKEPKNASDEERLNWLATLVAQNHMEIKVAFTPPQKSTGMYHEKTGILYDVEGNKIAFTGSINETINAFHNNYESMISVAEFIQMVNVQSETIEKYIREGSIVPDSVVPQSEHRSVKLFRKGTVLNYANQFGWTVITDENRKDVFLSMIDQMDMSYSYKPVLIKALLYCIDDNGECGLPDLVTRFMDFYQKRITEGKIAEKDASCFSKPDCSYEDAEKVILIYPFKRFADIKALNYDKDSQIVSIDSSIWDFLSNNEKQLIEKRCDEKIKEYFERLEA